MQLSFNNALRAITANIIIYINTPFFAENEVDGEAFLLLTEGQIRSMVKAIGAQNKLISRVKYLVASGSNHGVSIIAINIMPV